MRRKNVVASLTVGAAWVPLSALAWGCSLVQSVGNGAGVAAVSLLIMGGALRPLYRRQEG